MHFFCVQLAVGILICNVFDDVFAVEIAPKAFKFQWSRRETRVEMLWKENADLIAGLVQLANPKLLAFSC